ncbi:hypothetical protein ACFFDA_11845 (plasmid) [Novosphingobium sp. BL-52-GroH]
MVDFSSAKMRLLSGGAVLGIIACVATPASANESAAPRGASEQPADE